MIAVERQTSFYCASCDARIPATTATVEVRRRQHQAVHDQFATQRAKEAVRA